MKNKEIEELLNKIKQQFIIDEKFAKDFHKTTLNYEETKNLLSYIEQLEADYKELNDSITWWNNRFNAVERDNRDYKSRIDKAIEILDVYGTYRSETADLLYEALRGDSDE